MTLQHTAVVEHIAGPVFYSVHDVATVLILGRGRKSAWDCNCDKHLLLNLYSVVLDTPSTLNITI